MTFLLLYLEDAPLGTGLAGTGLSKAFNPMFKGLLSDDATRVCVVQTHQMFDPSYFVEGWFSRPAWASQRLDWLVARVTARLPWPLAYRAAILHGFWIAYRLRRALKDQLPAGSRILAPIGVDLLTLVRADALARSLRGYIEPYLVDDLQYHPANIRWRNALGNALSRLLLGATHVYCITDGLCALLYTRHAVRAKTLHLVAEPTSISVPHKKQYTHGAFAFFLGSINHLYAEGLRLLIHQVAELRKLSGQNLIIRLCSNHAQVRELLGEIPQWIEVGSIADHKQIEEEIAAATFCFMPYSFAADAKSMVESSFPSKMIDYLSHSNAIVVFSPETAVPFRLMLDNDLPYACSTPNALLDQLCSFLKEKPILSIRYRSVLDKLFSVKAMWRTLGYRKAD